MQQHENGLLDLPISEKYMLSIKGASAYFYIGIKNMRRIAENNAGDFTLFIETFIKPPAELGD